MRTKLVMLVVMIQALYATPAWCDFEFIDEIVSKMGHPPQTVISGDFVNCKQNGILHKYYICTSEDNANGFAGAEIYLYFYDDKLFHVAVEISQDLRKTILTRIVNKYGVPLLNINDDYLFRALQWKLKNYKLWLVDTYFMDDKSFIKVTDDTVMTEYKGNNEKK